MMHFKKAAFTTLIISLSTALSGCFLAPGMHMDTSSQPPSINQEGQVVTAQINPITAQLIQQQQKQADAALAIAIKEYNAPKGFVSDPANYAYHIGIGDVLTINVWNYLALNNPMQTAYSASNAPNSNSEQLLFTVNPQGAIYYPYVGYIKVAGDTEDQLRNALATNLSKTVKNPQVNVQVTGFNSQHVVVRGAVETPVVIPVNDVPLNLIDAITQAKPIQCGVYTSSGQMPSCADLNDVTVTQDNIQTTVNANTLQAVNGSSTNWILKNGAVVTIPNNNKDTIFVLGAVLSPGPYYMVDGQMSLQEALGNARGVANLSDPKYTYVIRNYDRMPQIFVLDARSPGAFNLANEFELEPQDVVFVSVSKLQTFNEVLAEINPTLTTLSTTLGTAAYVKVLN